MKEGGGRKGAIYQKATRQLAGEVFVNKGASEEREVEEGGSEWRLRCLPSTLLLIRKPRRNGPAPAAPDPHSASESFIPSLTLTLSALLLSASVDAFATNRPSWRQKGREGSKEGGGRTGNDWGEKEARARRE